MTVQAFSDRAINQQRGKLTTRGTNKFKLLYHICMTGGNCKERALKVHGYVDGIYLVEWAVTGGV